MAKKTDEAILKGDKPVVSYNKQVEDLPQIGYYDLFLSRIWHISRKEGFAIRCRGVKTEFGP
jgi:hypothetical protein